MAHQPTVGHRVEAPPIAPGAGDWRALADRHFDGEIVLADDLTRLEALTTARRRRADMTLTLRSSAGP